MKRQIQLQKRQHVLMLVHRRVKRAYRTPSYKSMVQYLNRKNIPTSRGNPWTRKALFRFLQNAGYSGLWGLSKCEGLPVIRHH